MKKTVLITAYAVNPQKGSEDGIGWNIIRHLAIHADVLAITRHNNRTDIEQHLAQHPLATGENLRFEYYDLPPWAAFWKRGGRGALLYHYLWHLGVAFFILRKKWRYDLAHHLNFNSDWSPSFLWLLGKPFIWGPVGHHPKIPREFILPFGKKAWLADPLRWWVKCFFWNFDPFLFITKRTASKVIGLNSSVAKVLRLPPEKVVTLPAIASELPESQQIASDKFKVLSIGRFVPLKGFDVTVRAFALFYQQQNITQQSRLELVLIGKGPERNRLQSIAETCGLPAEAVRFVDWVERAELPRFFASSKAFLFPSHEGGGMVVAEAMGFGLPVLCFDNEGPGENVDETCGVKVAYSLGYDGAVSAFAAALNQMLHDEDFQRKLSEGARRYFAKNFSWEKKAERIAGVYEQTSPPAPLPPCGTGTARRGAGGEVNSTLMKKIIFVHLLNDYSGSPLVLSTAIRCFVEEGLEVEVVTCSGGEGFLSRLKGVRYRFFNYRFHENKLKRTLALLRSQVAIFFKMLANAKGDTVVYVNTLLPFGAALAGRLLRKKVVYHLHETTVNPPFLKAFLKKMASVCASEAIYVSHFLMEQEPLPGVPSRVIYNCLPQDFVKKAEAHLSTKPSKTGPFTVLMLCSLKAYKGVGEYLRLAERLPDLRFVLVLNTSYASIQRHFEGQQFPDNLVVFPAQNDVHFFYREAHLVVNLSHPEQWVETFGMTLLEAMSYGLPVIAPPVGGPVELVQDGFNGYRVDQRNLSLLSERVLQILEKSDAYQRLSANARAFAGQFSEQRFGGELVSALH